MSELLISERFLSVANLKPKLKWFFKPKLKPIFFLLNWTPDGCRGRAAGILQERRRHRLGHWVGIHPRTVGPVCSGETGQLHRRHAEKAGRSQGGDLIEKFLA